jgi:heme-degrading monooxygenase HmoA
MYARATTIHATPQNIDDGIAYVRDEVMPMVQQLDGCVGVSLLVDRDSGRCIVTTAWESEEAMHASAEQVRASRERAAEVFGGGQMEVQEWEIAVLHRMRQAGDGACARVTWVRGDPANVDRLLDGYRMTLMPRFEEMPGFCSNSLLINRESGRGVGAVTFDSREALERTREQARSMREEFASAMSMEIMEVAEFDLVLAHLRVPETV